MADTTRTTQLAVEVITEGTDTVRVTQLAVEVITAAAPTPPTPGTQPIIIIST